MKKIIKNPIYREFLNLVIHELLHPFPTILILHVGFNK